MTETSTIKVLYVDNTSTFGGAIVSLGCLVKGIKAYNVEPVVVTSQSKEIIANNFKEICIIHKAIEFNWYKLRLYNWLVNTGLIKNRAVKFLFNKFKALIDILVFDIKDMLYFYYLIKKYKINCIHLNNMVCAQYPIIAAAKLAGIPCICHIRDYEVDSSIVRYFLQKADGFIAISKSISDRLVALGVDNKKITIIHNPVDLTVFSHDIDNNHIRSEFHLTKEDFAIGIFGRIVRWKGIDEFVEACLLVLRKYPQTRIFIVGNESDGEEDYVNMVKNKVANSRYSTNFVFTGYRSDVAALMSVINIVVHASITPEPFGRVLIEAMALGKPVIATAAGGPLEVIENMKNGILVEPRSILQLSEAIILLLENTNLLADMGLHARLDVERKYSISTHADKVFSIYQSVLNR